VLGRVAGTKFFMAAFTYSFVYFMLIYQMVSGTVTWLKEKQENNKSTCQARNVWLNDRVFA
jgi:hypothetical protein